MKEKTLVLSTGEMGNNAFADALIGAVTKAAKENPVLVVEAVSAPASVLLNLDEINVEVVVIPTLKAIETKVEEEVNVSKQWAEAAGRKLAQLDENIEKIQAEISKVERRIREESDLRLSGTLKSLLSQLKETQKKELAKKTQLLAVGDDALRAHVGFSRLLEEIRGVDPAHLGEVHDVLDRAMKMGRYRLATQAEIDAAGKPEGRWPSGALFLEGKVYYSIVSDASKSNGQKALEAELRKLIDAAKMSKAAAIKTRGNPNLTGFEIGKPGLYYMFSPKRTEGERKFSEGHALVELKDINKGKYDWKDGKKVFRAPFVVVEVKDAIGSLSRFVSDRWVPYYWVKMGKVITKDDKRLEQEEFDRADRMIRTLRALYVVWRKGLNPEVAKPKEVKPEAGPAVNAVKDTDMEGIIVETKPAATAVKAEKPTKKSKKTVNPNEEFKQVGRLW